MPRDVPDFTTRDLTAAAFHWLRCAVDSERLGRPAQADWCRHMASNRFRRAAGLPAA